MALDLATARAKLADEASRRASALAEIVRLPPAATGAAHGWLGPFAEPSPATAETIERPDMARARERLEAERERYRRAAEPRVRPPAGVTWRPTPTRRECDILGTTAGAVTPIKLWDLSPIDQSSFDPFQPPSELPPPPTKTNLPTVVELTDHVVGSTLVCNGGSWVPAGSTITRQWKRAGVSIPGEVGATYVLTDDFGGRHRDQCGRLDER
jgi:hypothetical protein